MRSLNYIWNVRIVPCWRTACVAVQHWRSCQRLGLICQMLGGAGQVVKVLRNPRQVATRKSRRTADVRHLLPARPRKDYERARRYLDTLERQRREQQGVLQRAKRRSAPLKRRWQAVAAAAAEKRAVGLLQVRSRLGRKLQWAEQDLRRKRVLAEDPPLKPSLVVVPLKELQLRAAKYDVVLREASLWATLAMHTILTRMVMFRCRCCNAGVGGI